MNARGTRRPHSRRPRSKPVKVTRRGGNSGCRKTAAVLLLVFAGGLAALGWAAVQVIA